jgi:hypothetical protein
MRCGVDGIVIRPDGVNELDPCLYEEIEIHYGCIVHVMRCRRCGHVEISWERGEDYHQGEVSEE